MSPGEAQTATQATHRARDRNSGRGARRSATDGGAALVLGRYRLQRRLGAGGYGTVWMAIDERLERDVAVKILPRERIVGGRFEREAKAAARLAHPGIVTLYEAAVDDQDAYLVSELVRGSTLDALLAAGRLSDHGIVAIGIALCDALEHAHAQGVVHRDVKPSNVLVPSRPVTSAQRAKLTDFGVARVVGGDRLTLTGDVVGTLAYMAPEQAEGLPADATADLYSLALVLYEALTGVNPVKTGEAARRARRLGAHLPPVRRQRRDLPPELGQGIDMALRPRPRERGRILDLRRALVAAQEHVRDEPGVVGSPWGRHTAASAAEPPGTACGEPGSSAQQPEPARASRVLAAVGAAAIAAWVSSQALHGAPIPPAAAALLGAAVILVLPRLGWLIGTVASCGLVLAQGHSGLALVLLPLLSVPALLMPRAPRAWPLVVGAPALGLIGLAGAWPALAGRALSPVRRAGIAASGWLWLLLAGSVVGRGLYLPRVRGIPPTEVWASSPYDTLHHVLAPVASDALAPAVVWALGAVLLPHTVGGRWLALDCIRVTIWSAMLTGATVLSIAAAHGSGAPPAALNAILGAVAGAVLALAAGWLTPARLGWSKDADPAGPGGQFP